MTLVNEFLCVARKMSITAAARELNMSQPNLSRHMQRLEDELGFQLFYTQHRRIYLTPAGKFFYNNASIMSARFERMVEGCRGIAARNQAQQEEASES